MRGFRHLATIAAVALPLSISGMVLSSTDAGAYGAGAVAQLTISGNCDNPSFSLCAPAAKGGVGLGGIWIWMALYRTSASTTTGSVDGTLALCTHGHGAKGGSFTSTWTEYTTIHEALTAHAIPILTTRVAATLGGYGSGPVYDILLPGVAPIPFAFPAGMGHYDFHPVAGVSIQIQVAP